VLEIPPATGASRGDLKPASSFTRNPFDAKYSKVEDTDWETSPLVIDPSAVRKILRKSWMS